MTVKLDEKDIAILALIQENSKLTARQIAQRINAPITTVFAKTKRMEEFGIIREYRAVLAPEKLDSGTAAFILASVSYHIITGDWDLLIKLRAESVESIGKFVVDNLRLIKGLEKTLTCMVFETVKETTKIHLPLKKSDKH